MFVNYFQQDTTYTGCIFRLNENIEKAVTIQWSTRQLFFLRLHINQTWAKKEHSILLWSVKRHSWGYWILIFGGHDKNNDHESKNKFSGNPTIVTFKSFCIRTWKNTPNKQTKVTVYAEWIEIMGKYMHNERVDK